MVFDRYGLSILDRWLILGFQNLIYYHIIEHDVEGIDYIGLDHRTALIYYELNGYPSVHGFRMNPLSDIMVC